MSSTPKNTTFVIIPYGSIIASVSKGENKYGFNGKQTDSQTGLQDYGERIYNSSITKFLSADPLIIKGKQYSELSTYQFASNTSIQAIDLDGLEANFILIGGPINATTTPVQNLNTAFTLAKNLSENLIDAYTLLIARGRAAFVNEVTYGYGVITFDKGNATNLKQGYLRLNWENGFIQLNYSQDNSNTFSNNSHSISYNDGLNFLNTNFSIASSPLTYVSTIVEWSIFDWTVKTPTIEITNFGFSMFEKELPKKNLNITKELTHKTNGNSLIIRANTCKNQVVKGLLYKGNNITFTDNAKDRIEILFEEGNVLEGLILVFWNLINRKP